jgi:hypothetical protein
MGCQFSNIEVLLYEKEKFSDDQIKKRIYNAKLSHGVEAICEFCRDKIDENIGVMGGLYLNPLAIGIVLADFYLVRHLHQNLHASFDSMENSLQDQNSNGFELIIMNYNEKVMSYYTSIYTKSQRKQLEASFDTTLNFHTDYTVKTKKKMYPVHYATELKNIKFLEYVSKQFFKLKLPEELNIHSTDEESGENCALISCRVGDLALMKFLHKKKCNFFVLNKHKENALHIALLGCKLHPATNCLPVIEYLVEVVGIDLGYELEETLLLARDKAIVEYLEKTLQNKGIYITKKQIERNHDISIGYSMIRSIHSEYSGSDPSICSSITDQVYDSSITEIIF